ncbi:SulP family inorganic anion transporter [Magnetospirillum sp. 15-1]|uniref:SulP family inorganic anion transporter n=1 Tax=Magnetospirillum sp. 15-1 TaxID=1979370 RepID=UPI001F5B96F8|nr:SulP family inorganic anion transporter [Magnetospirillum sp. 15-1]
MVTIRKEELPAALVAGAVTGLVVVILSLSFAVLIFSGELAGHVGTAIGMALFTAVVVGGLVALFGSYPGTIAFPQDKIAPILALMASMIVAETPPGTDPEQLFATVATALMLATALTGLLLFALGHFRLGGFIRFIPYPVIGGFLAGTGWLLVKGAIKVMTGHAPTLETAHHLLSAGELIKWAPGLLFAVALIAGMRRWKHVATLPLLLGGGIALYHLAARLMGMSLDGLEQGGYLLGHFPAAAGWRPDAVVRAMSADWLMIADQAGSVSTILLISAIGLLLNSSGIEVAANRDMDLNRELKIAGIANLVSGAGGGIIGFHTLGLSSMVLKMGVRSRLVGLISALVCLAMLVIGTEPLALFPKAVLGGLLMFIGLGFLEEWLVEGRHQMPAADYAIILMIVGVVGTFGYLQGAAVGIVACVVLFVVNYSRVAVAKHELTAAEVSSNVDRPRDEVRLLKEYGGRILVFSLQGFMFFGTANKLLTRVIGRCGPVGGETGGQPVEVVVFDFRRVAGIDTSAAMSFVKLRQFAEKRDLSLVFASCNDEVGMVLERAGFVGAEGATWRTAPDLDHALEWSENRLLARLAVEAGARPRSLMADLAEDLGEPLQVARMMSFVETLSVPAGSVVLEQGSAAHDLFILESGQVTVRLMGDNGSSIRLRTMHAGTVVGEMGLYLNEERSASVVADSDCVIHRLTARNLERMEDEAPAVAAAFHRLMARQLAERLRNTDHMIRALTD